MTKTITLKLSNIVALIVSVLIVGLMIQVLFWSSQPSVVLTINNDPVPVQPPEVNIGSEVYLNIDFCQSISALMVTEVHLLGERGADIGVAWPPGRVEKGCYVYPKVPVPIPGHTPSDTYVLTFKSCANINPLKDDQCTEFKSQSFRVVNAKLNPGDAKVQ